MPDGHVEEGSFTGDGPVDAFFSAINAATGLEARLKELRLSTTAPIETYSTPRRLTARVAKLSERQTDFEELVTGSLEGLQLLTEANKAWGLGSFARWEFDQDGGLLRFSNPNGVTATAPAQIIGTPCESSRVAMKFRICWFRQVMTGAREREIQLRGFLGTRYLIDAGADKAALDVQILDEQDGSSGFKRIQDIKKRFIRCRHLDVQRDAAEPLLIRTWHRLNASKGTALLLNKSIHAILQTCCRYGISAPAQIVAVCGPFCR